MSFTINTKINGKSISASAEASTSLLEFLRDTLEMKGSKLCCNTGECGACTIIYNGMPINSCVTMAADAIGAEITTIEGLADGDKLHPVQQAFIDTGAVQWLLHAGLHHFRQSAARPHHQADDGRHRRSGLRQHLSLHGLQQDRRRDPSRRRSHRREGMSHGQS